MINLYVPVFFGHGHATTGGLFALPVLFLIITILLGLYCIPSYVKYRIKRSKNPDKHLEDYVYMHGCGYACMCMGIGTIVCFLLCGLLFTANLVANLLDAL